MVSTRICSRSGVLRADNVCAVTGIVVQAYSPLVRMEKSNDPTLVKVAQEVGKETTQVLIRWSLQKGYVGPAIPNPLDG